MSTKRLYKSISDRKIAGVCGGIAEYLDIDPVIIRLICVASVFAGGLGILAYILGCIIIPEKKSGYREYARERNYNGENQHDSGRSEHA